LCRVFCVNPKAGSEEIAVVVLEGQKEAREKTMKSTIGDRIRDARENKEFDQATLADKVGIVTRTLQRWEKGEQIPDGISITRIAKATNVHPHWLLTGEGEMYPAPSRPANVFPLPTANPRREKLVDLPLISAVPAGRVATMFHPDYADEYVTVDDVKDPQAFALRVKGNSMSPRIEDGDVVVVSPSAAVSNGDIAVVRVDGEDTLKKVKFEGNYVHLIPLNTEFEPVTVKKKDVNFVWKVVKLIKEL
jgi:repressor LexA